jgi:hypothetical protein
MCLFVATSSFAETKESSQSLELNSCFVKGVRSKANCGVLEVAEDPSKPLSD